MHARVARPLVGSLVLVGALVPAPASAHVAGLPAAVVPAAAEASDDAVGEQAAGRVLVRFADGATANQTSAARAAVGATDAGAVGATTWRLLTVTRTDLSAVAAELRGAAGVSAVQLDHVREAAGWPSDPELAFSSFTYTRAQVESVRLPRAWDAGSGVGTVVAVVDEGTDATDADLAEAVLPGIDLVPAEPDPQLTQSHHGTAVSRIVAARADNGIGSAGVAHGSRVLPVRVLDQQRRTPDSRLAQGIARAVTEGADVVNVSIAGPATSPVLRDAITAATAAGVVVVAAAGNEGTEAPQYPAAYAPEIAGLLSVSASNHAMSLPSTSWGDSVTLAAPGQHLGLEGTSSAAAVVSGVAALVRGRFPALTPAEVEQRLVQTAQDAGPRGQDPWFGSGIVDAAAAITLGDAAPAAPRVPLVRVAGDPGASDDTRDTARALPASGADATLAPEGDVDWYRFDAPARGLYSLTVAGAAFEPTVEVRDASGSIVGSIDRRVPGTPITMAAAAAGPLYIGVSTAGGAAVPLSYRIAVSDTPARTAFVSSSVQVERMTGKFGVGDLTGDGILDVASTAGTPARIVVLPGLGDGRLGPESTTAADPLPTGEGALWAVAVADLDSDGDDDLVYARSRGFTSWDEGFRTFLQSDGHLSPGDVVGGGGKGEDVVAADMNDDGHVDLVLTSLLPSTAPFPYPTYSTTVALNDGAGHFTSGPAFQHTWRWARAGDVDADGRVDVIGSSTWHRQLADGTYQSQDLPAVSVEDGDVAVADLTGDGHPDVVRTDRRRALLWVHPGVPGGGFGPPASYGVGSSSVDALPLTVADVDGDGLADVVVDNVDEDIVHIWYQKPDGTLTSPDRFGLPAHWSGGSVPYREQITVVDLDDDGTAEIVSVAAGVSVMHQLDPDHTAGHGWVRGLTPAPHASGVAVRPTVTVRLEAPIEASSVTPTSVRLVDAVGAAVQSSRTYDVGTRTIRLTPSADLVPGGHYEVVVSGLVDTSGTVQPAPARTWFTVAASGSRFTPIDPWRVLDTRDPMTAAYGIVRSGEKRRLDLGWLPADATSVVMTVTSVGQASMGNIRVFPTGSGAAPVVSNLNVVPGVDQPNLVTVKVGADRSVTLMPDGPTVHLIVDVAGYYSPGGATAFEPLAPTRVMDTRDGTGVAKGQVTGGHWVDLRVAGVGDVPVDASSVVLNVTGTSVAGRCYVSAYPTPDPGADPTPPTVSNLNLYAGRDQANLVTVKVGDGGRVRFYVSAAATHLVADVAGYYTATGDNGFVPVTPTRLADTRAELGFTGPLRSGVPADLKVTGAVVPADATAAVLNIAGVGPRRLTHVRAFPTTVPATLPEVSSINLVPGRDEANLAVLRLGAGGKDTFYAASSDTDLVVDAFGYFRTYD
ncbi:S8 family serine peptidase [Cellulomonas sp. Leaf334]|uniref:S8 family serine peptidase n=1 Tax=Cellulomonas sp. Leaf334 TaxID=1736339 RepID=UPI0006F855ED|nr:S8 family serine peptidase [Cellulomonas sp. Leaf334]KQR17615.1 hypothetical protein ASF78_10205 [Cellulomonas sp. Leaf334]